MIGLATTPYKRGERQEKLKRSALCGVSRSPLGHRPQAPGPGGSRGWCQGRPGPGLAGWRVAHLHAPLSLEAQSREMGKKEKRKSN